MSGGLFALMSKKGREDKRMKELKSAFDQADKDGDGKLDMNEWFDVLKEIGAEVSRLVNTLHIHVSLIQTIDPDPISQFESILWSLCNSDGNAE